MRTPINHSAARTAVALTATLVIALAGCSSAGEPPAGDNAPVIAVTTDIWTDVARNVICMDDVDFLTLIPSGADLHSVEPSLTDRAAMSEADLVVVNGLDLEEAFIGTIDAVSGDGVAVVALAEDDEQGHSGRNPHVWLDPGAVIQAVDVLAASAIEIGLDPALITECAVAYKAELADLVTELEATIDTLPPGRRLLITDHDVLDAFAARFGMEIIGTVTGTNSTLAAPSPAHLSELADLIVNRDIHAIFSEVASSDRDLEALAAAAGDVEVVEIRTASLGPAGSSTGTYINMMRQLAQDLVTVLAK